MPSYAGTYPTPNGGYRCSPKGTARMCAHQVSVIAALTTTIRSPWVMVTCSGAEVSLAGYRSRDARRFTVRSLEALALSTR